MHLNLLFSDVQYVRTEPRSRCYKTYSEDDMQRAIEATRGGMSALKAARNFGIPSRTLYCRIRRIGLQQEGVVKLEVKSSPPPTATTVRDKNTEGESDGSVIPPSPEVRVKKKKTQRVPKKPKPKTQILIPSHPSSAVAAVYNNPNNVEVSAKEELPSPLNSGSSAGGAHSGMTFGL
jgi:hypothetical protein